MAHLITALASGINGAENGTAEIYSRGTSSRATYYNDFIMSDAVSDGSDVDLDSNGGATIYVLGYVDVVVKDSGGTAVRSFTDGCSASNTEVISDSFTGTNYTDSSTGVSKPATLATILDKWNDSAGSIDWKVLVGSTSTNLSTAIAGLSGMFFNVKDPAYGAEGDGSTNDTTAIQAAIDAAELVGGIVFFPPGTYVITSTLVCDSDITLMGCGLGLSIINNNSGSNDETFDIGLSGSSDHEHYTISGLSFTCAQANTGNYIENKSSWVHLTIEKCLFDTDNITGVLIDCDTVDTYFLTVRDCFFYIKNIGGIIIDSGILFARICNNIFISDQALTADTITIDGIGQIIGNTFYCASAAAGYNCISINSGDGALIVGNYCSSGSGYGIECVDEDNPSPITEICNITSIRAAMVQGSLTSKGDNSVSYLSRLTKHDHVAWTSGGAKTLDTVSSDTFLIDIDTDAAITVDAGSICPQGSKLTLIFQQLDATPPAVTWGDTFESQTGSSFTMSDQFGIVVFEFVSVVTTDTIGGTTNLKWLQISATEYEWTA